MFAIFDPNTSPNASSGLGVASLTADMFVDNSGSDVANATSRLPTNNRPHPVRVANASPYFANNPPKYMTATALPRNMATGMINALVK